MLVLTHPRNFNNIYFVKTSQTAIFVNNYYLTL